MTQESLLEGVRQEHSRCCITDSYEENRCGLDMRGLDRSELVTLHGTRYQSSHRWQGRLCDRIIFGRVNGNFVCAVEFKGGRSADISTAIDQIQGGLNLAVELRLGQWATNWLPLLVYSGSVPRDEVTVIRTKQVSFRNQRRLVRRVDCGSSLLSYLNRQ